MKHLRADVERYLENQPLARERANKDRGIVNILLSKYPSISVSWKQRDIAKETIISFVQDYASMDRAWRKVMEERPELRGSDYNDKKELEKEAQRALGYQIHD